MPQISKTIKGKLVNDSWPEFKVIVSRFDDQDFIENGRQEQVGKIFQFCGDWAPAETSVHMVFPKDISRPILTPLFAKPAFSSGLILGLLAIFKAGHASRVVVGFSTGMSNLAHTTSPQPRRNLGFLYKPV